MDKWICFLSAKEVQQELKGRGDILLLQPCAKRLFTCSRLTDAHVALCITTVFGRAAVMRKPREILSSAREDSRLALAVPKAEITPPSPPRELTKRAPPKSRDRTQIDS